MNRIGGNLFNPLQITRNWLRFANSRVGQTIAFPSSVELANGKLRA